MLYPQSNSLRQALDISGSWDFCTDPDSEGEAAGWPRGLPASRPVAVPASWNDQYLDLHDYLGLAWYQTRFDLPWGWEGRKISLRFGSVNYLASVWVNGELAGRHEGGHRVGVENGEHGTPGLAGANERIRQVGCQPSKAMSSPSLRGRSSSSPRCSRAVTAGGRAKRTVA